MKSKILVFLQFFIIFLMLLPLGEKMHYLYAGMFFSVAGVIIGLLAINTHERGNFNIRPDIKEECELVTHGIYTYIRHPMYLSVLTIMLGVVLIYFSFYEIVLYIVLVSVMLTKLFYEEHLWQYHSQEYEVYKKHTKRLVPFIF
ncbi:MULTISPECIES: isoprenylcysteine carboxylmethyltransferase family protein [Sulfurimonas]|uniref:methyltransferase family protein n=1 Tax=Sulfurimonas TaxID=202746 RepID=UPI0012650D33|nr:isoprenylcysteine carboxylmethyltransferase family protein [Sulfurimonas indica]